MQKVKDIVKRWGAVFTAVFSIALLVGGVILVQRPKETKTSEAAGATQISITPSAVLKSKDETFSVNVYIDTGENTVSATDIEINYDASKLQGVSITKGDFLPQVLIAGNIDNGKATIILGCEVSNPKQGTGTLATITFKVLADDTTTQITVSENTKVAAIGEDGNVLTTRNLSEVTIGAPASIEPTVPPTVPPTDAPTIEPTVSPTDAPTIGPTPTPTLSPTDVPTVEPTIPPTVPPTGASNGDVNDDGIINIVDIGIIIDNYGLTPPTDPRADINGDGVVNVVDIGIVIDNYQ